MNSLTFFDLQQFDGKPSPAAMGMQPASYFQEYYLCNSADRGFVEAWVTQQAQSAQQAGAIVVLDVESRQPLDIRAASKSCVVARLKEMLYLVGLIRQAAPKVKVGSLVHLTVPNNPLDCDATQVKTIQASNDFQSEYTANLDYFSTMSTYLNGGDGLGQFNPRKDFFLGECDRVDPGHTKPRYLCLFPWFNSKPFQPIPSTLWWEMLRSAQQDNRVDGVIIYDNQAEEGNATGITAPFTIDKSPNYSLTAQFAKGESLVRPFAASTSSPPPPPPTPPSVPGTAGH